jgi:hypothetical protein
MALPASATQQQHFVVVWQQLQEQQQHPRVVGRNMAATAAASARATLAPQQHVQRCLRHCQTASGLITAIKSFHMFFVCTWHQFSSCLTGLNSLLDSCACLCMSCPCGVTPLWCNAFTASCRSIAVHPNLPYVLTSSDDMLIKLWDWDKGWACCQVFEGHSHYVMQVRQLCSAAWL